MTDPAVTPEPIIVTVRPGQWCRHCLQTGQHEHVWQPPTRCTATFDANDDGLGRCERDAGHDVGPFPRYSWDHGRNGVTKIDTGPTPHVVSWGL